MQKQFKKEKCEKLIEKEPVNTKEKKGDYFVGTNSDGDQFSHPKISIVIGMKNSHYLHCLIVTISLTNIQLQFLLLVLKDTHVFFLLS